MPEDPPQLPPQKDGPSHAEGRDETGPEEVAIEHVMQGFAQFALSQASERQPGLALTGEQLDRFLVFADKSDERSHKREMSKMVWSVAAFAALLGFVLLLSWLFLAYQKSEVLVPLMTAIGGLIAGFVGGYGWAKREAAASEEK